jgi:site-specific DNA-methyltransferase (cytosine-N4-specific)
MEDKMISTPWHEDDDVRLYLGDSTEVLSGLQAGSVDCVVTSPPYYGLRDYSGSDIQLGAELTPMDYVHDIVTVMHEAYRVLADDGTLWLNVGDTYSTQHTGGSKADPFNRPMKNVLGLPWRIAFAMQDDGWILRNEIIWYSHDKMPSSAQDRLTVKHEQVFLFSKYPRYYFNLDPIRVAPSSTGKGMSWAERKSKGASMRRGKDVDARLYGNMKANPRGANPGDVWSINTDSTPSPMIDGKRVHHPAVFPIELPKRCIAAGCREHGTVLDMFNGSGTTGKAALELGRKYVGIDCNEDYLKLSLQQKLDDRQSSLFM